MFEQTLVIFGQRFATYSLALSLAVLISLLIALRKNAVQRAVVLDVALAAMLGGLVGARVLHVLAHWDYFRVVPDEILMIRSGGLSWHGALIGALLLGALTARYRGIPPGTLQASAAWTLPVMALAGWWGCWAAACAYGREVATLADYPAWLVWEGRDIFGIVAPRFHTQLLGLLAALTLLCIAWWLARRNAPRRFWWLWLLWSLLMFAIGFLRGDAVLLWHSLRLDQVYDLILIGFAAVCLSRRQSITHPA